MDATPNPTPTAATPAAYADARLVSTGVRRLTPQETRLFEGTFSLLHCQIVGENLFRGVFAVLMFPIRHPDRYVSLRYTDLEDKDIEIGVIEDLSTFPEEAQRLIRSSLVKQYYEQTITRIYKVEYKHNMLFFRVGTADGDKEFVMWWSYDRALEYGTTGKVLLDAFENRYIIPDVSALPASDRLEFTSFIYW